MFAGMLGSYGRHVETAATIVVVSLYLSPAIEVHKVNKTKGDTLSNVNPVSLVAMYCNCAAWLIYGLFYPVPPCIAPNAIGLVACCYFLGSCWRHAAKRRDVQNWDRRSAFATVCAFALSVYFCAHAAVSPEQAEHVGYFAMALNVMMYGSPLSAISRVLMEQSSATLPPLQCGLGLCCSCLWLCVGLNNENVPTIIPNLLGVPLAVIQIVLICWFPRTARCTREELVTGLVMGHGLVTGLLGTSDVRVVELSNHPHTLHANEFASADVCDTALLQWHGCLDSPETPESLDPASCHHRASPAKGANPILQSLGRR